MGKPREGAPGWLRFCADSSHQNFLSCFSKSHSRPGDQPWVAAEAQASVPRPPRGDTSFWGRSQISSNQEDVNLFLRSLPCC